MTAFVPGKHKKLSSLNLRAIISGISLSLLYLKTDTLTHTISFLWPMTSSHQS